MCSHNVARLYVVDRGRLCIRIYLQLSISILVWSLHGAHVNILLRLIPYG
jgi:hypothetical protein